MRSFLAALRTLVLPYGAITGPRIILDGINGIIEAIGGTGAKFTIEPGAVIPILRFTNSAGTDFSFINAPPDGTGVPQLGMNSGVYASSFLGYDANARLYLATGNGGFVSHMGYVNDGTQAIVGGAFLFGENYNEISVYQKTGAFGAGIAMDDSAIFMQARLTGPTIDMTDDTWYLSAGTALNNWIEFSNTNRYFKMSPTNGGGWRNLVKINGWVDQPAPGVPVSYQMTPDGRVQFRGSCQGGVSADGTVVGTLPVGFRAPQADVWLPLVSETTGGAGTPRFRVATTGVIAIFGCGVGPIHFNAGFSAFL